MKNVRTVVTRVLVVELCVSEDSVVDDASIMMDLGANSLDIVEVIMALESEFDIDIPDEDAEGLRTVGEIVKYLEGRVENG